MKKLWISFGIMLLLFYAYAATTYVPMSSGATTYSNVTNALGLTGSTSTYLRSDGTQSIPVAGEGQTNFASVYATNLNAESITVNGNEIYAAAPGNHIGFSTNGGVITMSVAGKLWNSVTLDGTNAVIDLTNSVAGIDKNFYYSLSTSNFIVFSNLVQGAQGTIWINAAGTPQGVNFSASYDNFSTNEIAPVFTITNRAVIAYKVGWGTDATNVMLAIKRK